MALRNSYDILQAVIEATPDAIFVKDLDGRYVLINEAAARFLGRAPVDIVGKNDLELYPEETARRFIADDKEVLAKGTAQVFEGVATGECGPQAYLVTKGVYRDNAGEILGVFGISHDITELRRAHQTLEHTREALFQSQKMEVVGQLTGGIAHDFNNILAVIMGNSELLKLHLRHDAYAHDLVDTVLRAALHGQDLTGDLLAFSRRRQLNPQPVEVNALVEGIVRLLGRTLGATIRITTCTSHEAAMAHVDAAALEAAVLNVALNARDAMPEGGCLTIRSSTVNITAAAGDDDDLAPGSYAMLALEDTGCGMAPEVAARVFEPFFTTKAGVGGTGLGLSMVYGFAKQSGGATRITSEPGRGTTVTIFLPLTDSLPLLADATAPLVGHTHPPRTILLVEDDHAVRNTVRRQLESLGHRVLATEAPVEALLLLQGPGAPDVLVTDVLLGTTMDGIELAEAARRLRPGLPIIFMSGYTAVPAAQERIRDSGAPLLSKPATMAQLQHAVDVVSATLKASGTTQLEIL
jgi:PAS domain S-box-containing protein